MAGPEDTTESKFGKGSKISGKLNFRGLAKIEGEAEGEITGEDIVIASGAVVSARISATRVTIAGVFSGEVTARERVELLATARAQCTISTPSLVLNEGATFAGDCRMPRSKIAAYAADSAGHELGLAAPVVAPAKNPSLPVNFDFLDVPHPRLVNPSKAAIVHRPNRLFV